MFYFRDEKHAFRVNPRPRWVNRQLQSVNKKILIKGIKYDLLMMKIDLIGRFTLYLSGLRVQGRC